MTAILTIDRIVASTPDDGQGLPGRVDRIMRRIADGRLDRTLGSTSLASDGEWCIPLVTLSASVDLERPDLSLEDQLAQAIIDAIAAAVGSSSGIVHYPRTVDALADLVASASHARYERAWAWAHIGLIGDAGECERQPRDCVLDALAARPAEALAAVIRAVSKNGVAGLHRLLGPDGWVRLADIVTGAHLGSVSMTRMTDPEWPDASDQPATSDSEAIARASRLAASSLLADAARTSRLRFDGQTWRGLAVLAVAEVEPAMVLRRGFASLVSAVAQIIAGAIRRTGETPSTRAESAAEATRIAAPTSDPRLPSPDTAALSAIQSRRTDAERRAVKTPERTRPPANVDERPTEDLASIRSDEHVGQPTRHAGLLFLLNIANDAAMPETLLDDPALDGFDPDHLLARLALTLAPMPDDDPALLAFAGLDEKRMRRGWSREPLPPEIFERIRTHADKWAAAASERMGRDDEDRRQVVAEIVERPGRIEREQGWIDVHLALADVDIDIRRAGLDLDPGWVPWLGSVVRFCYA